MKYYIDKSALVAEIEKRREESWLGNYTKEKGIIFDITNDILSFINTLEAKEMDLKRELDYNDYMQFFKEHPNFPNDWGFEEAWTFAEYFYKLGLKVQIDNLWKDAQGNDLPEIDREVIVLVKALPEHEDSLLKVSFAHRPPEYWEGENIDTGKVTRYYPERYDKGGWNIPNIKYWLDLDIPKQ